MKHSRQNGELSSDVADVHRLPRGGRVMMGDAAVWVEQHLLLGPYAVPAWLCYMAVTGAVSTYTIISGPILGTLPTGSQIVPGVMILLGWVWMLLGAVGGWLPGGAAGHRRR